MMTKTIWQTIAMRSFEAPHSYMGENKSETLMELSLTGRTETASAFVFHGLNLSDDRLGLLLHESELTNPIAPSDPRASSPKTLIMRIDTHGRKLPDVILASVGIVHDTDRIALDDSVMLERATP